MHAVLELLVYVQWSNKVFNSNFIQCLLYQLLFLLSMIQYRYLCRIFERKCSFDDVFTLFEVDQVNVKYVSRATQSRFFYKLCYKY